MLVFSIIWLIVALSCASIAYNSDEEFVKIASFVLALSCLGLSVILSPAPMEVAVLIALLIVSSKLGHSKNRTYKRNN